MRIGILQPGYLPWLGFFEQMYKSDVFVIYDDVQYDKQGWRNRNRIKTANGVQWLTVPVLVKFEDNHLVNEIKIDNFEEAYSKEWEYLVDIDIYFILKLAECLGMGDKKIIKSSTLSVTGDRIERLVNICKLYNADIFYEGAAGKNYIDDSHFAKNGIKVEYQDYKHPVYNQLHGDFVPYLSVIDILFNNGDKSLLILANPNLEVNK